MRRGPAIFIGCVRIATDIACMQILFTTMSHLGNGNPAWLDLSLWLLTGVLCFLVNFFLLERPRSLPALVGVNAVLLGVLLFVLIYFAPLLSTFFAHLVVVVMAIITVATAYYLAAKPLSLQKHLLYFDAYMLGMLWLFLAMAGGEMPATDLPIYLVLIVLNLICNMVLRSVESNVGVTLCGAPVRGALFSLGMVAGVSLLIFAVVRLLAASASSMVGAAWLGIKTALAAIWNAIERFLAWLVSLIQFDQELPPLELETMPSAEGMDEMPPLDVSPTALYVIGGILAAAVIIGVLCLLYRFRKKKLAIQIARAGREAAPRRSRLAGGARRRMAQLLAALRFRLAALRHRNTPPGVLVSLERWGRKHDMPRLDGETMREYCTRLSPAGHLEPVAGALDTMYFGGGGNPLSKSECRRLRRDFLREARETHKKTPPAGRPEAEEPIPMGEEFGSGTN